MAWKSISGTIQKNTDNGSLRVVVEGLATYISQNILINDKTSSFSLSLLDAGSLIRINTNVANVVTIPNNSAVAFPIGTQILVNQLGSGQTSFLPASGVTINSSGDRSKLSSQHSTCSLIKVDTNTWLLAGDITS